MIQHFGHIHKKTELPFLHYKDAGKGRQAVTCITLTYSPADQKEPRKMEEEGRGREPVKLLWYHQSEFYYMYHQHNPANDHAFQVFLVFFSLPKHAEIERQNHVKSTEIFTGFHSDSTSINFQK